jgi:outer membrane receptor protein involved in Fe transport
MSLYFQRNLFHSFVFFFTFYGIGMQEVAAQKAGRLSGNIIEKQQAIEFATVTIAAITDTNKILHFTTSDSVGAFYFEHLAIGKYQIKVKLIGYLPSTKPIELTNNNTNVALKNWEIKTDNTMLNEVVITSQKKLIEKTSEGFIINAAANITQVGGTATDLLKSTPTVVVDADGAITMRGKKPLILINGRNSKLSNTDLIPASSIESIEIINNVSAKYDANAQSGIINIRLKKNKLNGTNGALATGIGKGSRGRISSALLVNHKTEKWNLGLGYDNKFAGRTKLIVSNRSNFTIPDFYTLNQERNDERLERLQNLKFNVDYTPNEKNSFSIEAIGNIEEQDNNEKLFSKFAKQDKSFNTANNRQSIELERNRLAEFALNYTRSFDNPEQSLTANISTSLDFGRQNTNINTQNLDAFGLQIAALNLQRTHSYENSSESNAMLDFATPFTQKGTLETGYKGTYRYYYNDFEVSDALGDTYIPNIESSNILKYNEYIHAIYGLYHAYIGTEEKPEWKYSIGIRMEQVTNNGKTNSNNTNFINDYTKFFPNADITYIVGEDAFWKLSYGKRINRPDLDEFNPFVDITDALNPHGGNPYLKPEIIQALEFGYSNVWKKISFSSNIFYRYTENSIRNLLQPQGNGVILRSPVNIGTAVNYGIENVFSGNFSKLYDCNASISFLQQEINGAIISDELVQKSFYWFGKLINNFAITKTTKLQIIGNYTSAAITPQGRLIPLYNLDLGFQQKLGKGNARLGMVIVDVFNTLESGNKFIASDFVSSRISKADTRAIMLTFGYTFKSKFKDKLLENKFSKEF